MKKTTNLLIISICFILCSCDSRYQVFVKNETKGKVEVEVEYLNMFDIQFDSIRFAKDYKEEIRPNTYFKLLDKKELDYYDSLRYKITINTDEVVLLEPTVIGLPIKYVLIKTEKKKDTIFDPYDNELFKEWKSKGLIKRKGLGTTIIYLRE